MKKLRGHAFETKSLTIAYEESNIKSRHVRTIATMP